MANHFIAGTLREISDAKKCSVLRLLLIPAAN